MKKVVKKVKKAKEVVVEEPVEEPAVVAPVGITETNEDLGRADMNALAQKVNEIIRVINK